MKINGHNNGSPHVESKHHGRPIEINGETVFQWQRQHPQHHLGAWSTRSLEPKPEPGEKWRGLGPTIVISLIIVCCVAKACYDDYLADWQKTERQTFIEQAILTKGWDAHSASGVWDNIQKHTDASLQDMYDAEEPR